MPGLKVPEIVGVKRRPLIPSFSWFITPVQLTLYSAVNHREKERSL